MLETYEGKTVTAGELHEILNIMDEQSVLVVMLSGSEESETVDERQCEPK